jgi:hypothetical protein
MDFGALGCIVGGIIAWKINKGTNRKKSWIFLFIGAILAYLFPLLIAYTSQVTEIFQPPSEYQIIPILDVVRIVIRIAQSTIPILLLITFSIVVVVLSYLLFRQVKMATARIQILQTHNI